MMNQQPQNQGLNIVKDIKVAEQTPDILVDQGGTQRVAFSDINGSFWVVPFENISLRRQCDPALPDNPDGELSVATVYYLGNVQITQEVFEQVGGLMANGEFAVPASPEVEFDLEAWETMVEAAKAQRAAAEERQAAFDAQRAAIAKAEESGDVAVGGTCSKPGCDKPASESCDDADCPQTD